MLNRPLIGHGREFGSPQELARACADLLDLHPHVLGSTLRGTGRTLGGYITQYDSTGASRFCAVGFVKRVATGAPSYFAEDKQVSHYSFVHAQNLLLALHEFGRGAEDFGGWFEAVRPSAAEFAAMLRAAADVLDLPKERWREEFDRLRATTEPAYMKSSSPCPEQARALATRGDDDGLDEARLYLKRLAKTIAEPYQRELELV